MKTSRHRHERPYSPRLVEQDAHSQREADEHDRIRRLAEAGDLMWGDEGIDDPPGSSAA